ncbi:MAG: SAM-dependent methyltransferase [Treponema sp.]
MISTLPGKAWLSIPKFESHLYNELGLHFPPEGSPFDNVRVYNGIVYKEGITKEIFWKKLEMEEPFIATFSSITEASNILKSIQRNWAMYPYKCIRRAELIKQKLPFISEKQKQFPYIIPNTPMGIFTLLDEHTLFASSKTSSPLPLGQLHFIEDKINPPSRAYLKLYEALCLMDYYKRTFYKNDDAGLFNKGQEKPFNKCIDAGASPGGWTWVLDLLNANITAIDRAPLLPSLMNKPNIEFIKHDAFTLQPSYFGKVDWVFSDVICYPPRLLEWVHKWIDSKLCSQFICTIKMQGEPDMKSIQSFVSIPNSKIVSLTANKHELTWLCWG